MGPLGCLILGDGIKERLVLWFSLGLGILEAFSVRKHVAKDTVFERIHVGLLFVWEYDLIAKESIWWKGVIKWNNAF